MANTSTLVKATIECKTTYSLNSSDPTSPSPANGNMDHPQVFNPAGVSPNISGTKVYAKRSSIAASGTLALDVSNGSLVDPQGNAVTFSTVRAVHVFLAANVGGASSVEVDGDASNECVDLTATLGPGDDCHTTKLAGKTVDGTHKLLSVINNDGANAALVDVIIIGT